MCCGPNRMLLWEVLYICLHCELRLYVLCRKDVSEQEKKGNCCTRNEIFESNVESEDVHKRPSNRAAVLCA